MIESRELLYSSDSDLQTCLRIAPSFPAIPRRTAVWPAWYAWWKSTTQLLQSLEDEIKQRVSSRNVEGFHAVMGAVEEVTQVRLRER